MASRLATIRPTNCQQQPRCQWINPKVQTVVAKPGQGILPSVRTVAAAASTNSKAYKLTVYSSRSSSSSSKRSDSKSDRYYGSSQSSSTNSSGSNSTRYYNSSRRSKNSRRRLPQNNHSSAQDVLSSGAQLQLVVLDTCAYFRIYCKDNAWKNQASPELCAVVGAAKQVLLPWPVLHEVQWLQGGGSMSFDPLLHPDGGGRVMTATDIPQVMVQRHRIQIMSPGVESADIWRLRLAYPADRDPFDRQIASHAYDLLYNQDSAVFVTSDRCMQHCSMLRTLW